MHYKPNWEWLASRVHSTHMVEKKDSIMAFCGIARRDEIEQLYDAEMVCQRLNDHRRSQSNAHLQHFARLLD